MPDRDEIESILARERGKLTPQRAREIVRAALNQIELTEDDLARIDQLVKELQLGDWKKDYRDTWL